MSQVPRPQAEKAGEERGASRAGPGIAARAEFLALRKSHVMLITPLHCLRATEPMGLVLPEQP